MGDGYYHSVHGGLGGGVIGWNDLCVATLLLLFNSQLCQTLCDPTDGSTPGFPIPHHLPEFAQVHVQCISDAIQLSHLLSPSSPPALNFSQQDLFQ